MDENSTGRKIPPWHYATAAVGMHTQMSTSNKHWVQDDALLKANTRRSTLIRAPAWALLAAQPWRHCWANPRQTQVRAFRIASLLEGFGCNVFPDGQDGSGAAGTNTAAAFETAFQYLTANSGMGLTNRIYDSSSDQTVVPLTVSAAMPAVKWICCYAQGSTQQSIMAALEKLAAGGCLAWASGANESNGTVSGGGTAISAPEALAIQQEIFGAYPRRTSSAALVDTGSATYISDYWGALLAAAVESSAFYDGHDYPNTGCPSRDMWRRSGMYLAAGWKQGIISEFHPLLYNNISDEATGAYYTLCALLTGFLNYGVRALTWFSLYDYPGFAKPTGLFQRTDPTKPRLHAQAIAGLFATCVDPSPAKRVFQPGTLDYTVHGLPAAWAGDGGLPTAGGQSALFQAANGTFYLFLWWEQDTLYLQESALITVNFASPVAQVEDFSLTNPITPTPQPIQTLANVSSVQVRLFTEVHVLKISS